jgi:hypothetical protein
VIKEQQVV